MRKSEREITVRNEIDAIIADSRVCRLGLLDDEEPYIVPLNFGYDGQALYFHSAPMGRKIDLLKKRPRVCFEFDTIEGLIEAKEACHWGIRYRCVMGVGTAHFLEDPQEKQRALELLMRQYTPDPFSFPEKALRDTTIIKVTIESISGKQTSRAKI